MNLKSISFLLACALLVIAALLTPASPAAEAGTTAISDLPSGRGVYFRSARGWQSLRFTVMMPFPQNRVALEAMNLGGGRAITELPGPHAGTQIGDGRPTFYFRGVSPVDLYLVRTVIKPDYRLIIMPVSRDWFRDWARFRPRDVSAIDVQAVASDVVTVRPHAGLTPGEYTLAAVVDPANRWIRLGYDFGVGTSAAQ